MSETVSADSAQLLRRYGPWLAAGIAVLVVTGGVGRESTADRPIEDGYSVVTVGVAGQDESVAGYVPVHMHQPLNQRFQPTKDVARDEVPDRHRQLNVSDDDAARQVQAAMLEEDALSNQKKEDKAQKKNDMFSSLKDKDAGSLNKDRALDTDDSQGWGWLADGVQQEQGRIDTGPSEERSSSKLESSLRNDLFSREKPGISEPAESSRGGRGFNFNWRSLGGEQAP